MNKELAIKLAQTENLDIVQTMHRANTIFKNFSTDWDVPFQEQDICYMGLMTHMIALSDEVKDYAYISNKLILIFNHMQDVRLKKELLKFQTEECNTMYELLKKYNISYLLDDYFPQKTISKACGKGKYKYLFTS